MKNNENKEITKKDEQLKREDLAKVQGGVANLRETPREITKDISERTKSNM